MRYALNLTNPVTGYGNIIHSFPSQLKDKTPCFMLVVENRNSFFPRFSSMGFWPLYTRAKAIEVWGSTSIIANNGLNTLEAWTNDNSSLSVYTSTQRQQLGMSAFNLTTMGHFAPGTLNFLGGSIEDVVPINFKLAITNRGLNTIYEMVTFNALAVNPPSGKKQLTVLVVLFCIAAFSFITLLVLAVLSSLKKKSPEIAKVMAPAELNKTLEKWENAKDNSFLNKVETEMKNLPNTKVSMTETVTMEPSRANPIIEQILTNPVPQPQQAQTQVASSLSQFIQPQQALQQSQANSGQPIYIVEAPKTNDKDNLIEAIKQINQSKDAFVSISNTIQPRPIEIAPVFQPSITEEVKQIEKSVTDNVQSVLKTLVGQPLAEKIEVTNLISSETNALLSTEAAKNIELAKLSSETTNLNIAATEKIKLSEISESEIKSKEIENIALQAMKAIAGMK